jgi:DNA-binding GntR family transcriptional regulator
MVLETTAAQRLCEDGLRRPNPINRALIDELAGLWLVPLAQRSSDTQQVSQWDEEFHCALVAAAGNFELVRVHREVTEHIRIIRRLDFTQQARIDATYDEHGKILNAIRAKRSDQAVMLLRAHIETSQAEVKKITIHQFHMARQNGAR